MAQLAVLEVMLEDYGNNKLILGYPIRMLTSPLRVGRDASGGGVD